jgi:hypothetical protein
MRCSFGLFLVCVFFALVACDSPPRQASISTKTTRTGVTIEDRRLEVSCGQCQFGMQTIGCDLAVRIEGHRYFLDGTSIDDHGDAHSETGFCNCIREATISGKLQSDRLVVEKFVLLPLKQK